MKSITRKQYEEAYETIDAYNKQERERQHSNPSLYIKPFHNLLLKNGFKKVGTEGFEGIEYNKKFFYKRDLHGYTALITRNEIRLTLYPFSFYAVRFTESEHGVETNMDNYELKWYLSQFKKPNIRTKTQYEKCGLIFSKEIKKFIGIPGYPRIDFTKYKF